MLRGGTAISLLRAFLVVFLPLTDPQFATGLSTPMSPSYMGFDLGTSGARISIIQRSDGSYKEIHTDAVSWGSDAAYDEPKAWTMAVDDLLSKASDEVDLQTVEALCFSGTSASCLVVDGRNAGKVTRQPRMYNYNVMESCGDDGKIYGVQAMEVLEKYAPPRHTALSATGSLAKLLAWNAEQRLSKSERLCHQADYLACEFLNDPKTCGSADNARDVSSDWHNCLKLGYDVRNQQWPKWMKKCLESVDLSLLDVLPAEVVSPGSPMGTISQSIAEKYGLARTAVVVGGTTDSNAAFFAAVGSSPEIGTAVVSLGSTLAIKHLSSSYVEDASVGVYSHRFPSVLINDDSTEEAWLVGGASNVGCAILREEGFSNDELGQLSKEIDPNNESPLQYYPLTKKGERFPIADSNKKPVLEPRPESRAEFLHGILQGISDVEVQGFLTLGQLGAKPSEPTIVWTSGGGSRNDMWSEMRQRRLREAFGSKSQVQVKKASNVEASYGAAILAAASFS